MFVGCLVLVGNDIKLDTFGRQFEPYQWRPCVQVVTWDAVPEQTWLLKLRHKPAFIFQAHRGWAAAGGLNAHQPELTARVCSSPST